MSGVKQRILKGISNSGLQDWAFMVDEYDGIVDYERLTDEDIEELATYILDEIIKQPTLNENQRIVLEWLQAYGDKDGGSNPIPTVWYLLDLLLKEKCGKEVKDAFLELNRKQQAQVLQGFSEWALKQEESE